MIKLGSKVKDKVTGFSGILTSRTEYLYGANRLQIEAKVSKDGSAIITQWFDEPRVVIKKK